MHVTGAMRTAAKKVAASARTVNAYFDTADTRELLRVAVHLDWLCRQPNAARTELDMIVTVIGASTPALRGHAPTGSVVEAYLIGLELLVGPVVAELMNDSEA